MNIGFGAALFLVFLVLKLTHVIDWSWFWITSPLWIGFVIAIPFFAIGLRRAAKSSATNEVSRALDDYRKSLERRNR